MGEFNRGEIVVGKMTLKLETQDKLAHTEIEEVQGEHIAAVIQGIFGVFGVHPIHVGVTQVATSLTPQEEKEFSSLMQRAVDTRPVVVEKTPSVEVAKPQKNYYTKETHTAIHEAFNKALHVEPEKDEEGEELKYVLDKYLPNPPTGEDVPLHFKTGYKVKENQNGDKIKLYKTRYVCPKCEHQGTHYVPDTTDFVDCWECHCTMPMKKAVAGHTPTPDPFLNWYIAGAMKRVKIVTQEHYDKLREKARH